MWIPDPPRPRTGSEPVPHSRMLGHSIRCLRHESGRRSHPRDLDGDGVPYGLRQIRTSGPENIVHLEVCTAVLGDPLHQIGIADSGVPDVPSLPYGRQDLHVGRDRGLDLRRAGPGRSDRSFIFSNMPLPAPQTGQCQLSGSSSNGVPGGIPAFGSPFSGS